MSLNELSFPESAVLLITFNRPEQTRHVIQSLKENKIKRLYIANDGPRPGNLEDVNAREEIKSIISGIDWECTVHTNFREENLGGGPGPATAISWAFEHEDRLIILEDDCVPANCFFDYCSEMLERYKDDTRIWHISGNNYNEEFELPHSYTFSHFCHIWGWATWKRCWDKYDLYLSKIDQFEAIGGLDNVLPERKMSRFYTIKYHLISDNRSVKPYTWDYQLGFTIYSNNGLCIVPKNNLVKNIGYIGEHTSKKLDVHDFNISENFSIESHPAFIVPNREYDIYHFKNFITRKKPLSYRIVNRMKKIAKSLYSRPK